MDRYKVAVDDLKSQEYPNISETARKYDLDRGNLSKRFRGIT